MTNLEIRAIDGRKRLAPTPARTFLDTVFIFSASVYLSVKWMSFYKCDGSKLGDVLLWVDMVHYTQRMPSELTGGFILAPVLVHFFFIRAWVKPQ